MSRPIVDAHLDIAWNVLYNGRDLTRSVAEIRAAENEPSAIAMTSLPDFAAGSVALVFATLYVHPDDAGSLDMEMKLVRPQRCYRNPAEAEEQALEMLAIYEAWEEAGRIRIIRSRADLDTHLIRFEDDHLPGFLITMEGADPVAAPDQLPIWFERGVRMIGLAWESTRYAGGTGSSEGLTDLGRELLEAMAAVGIVHDASHLSEESFWEAVGLPHRGLCVTHGNARSLMVPPPGRRIAVPLNRHLSDQQIIEVASPHGAAERGVIGIALLNDFLDPRWAFSARGRETEVTVRKQVAAHMEHVAALAGWECVGIGSDVDYGYGVHETPVELGGVAEWALLGEPAPIDARAGVLGGNWIRFLREVLP